MKDSVKRDEEKYVSMLFDNYSFIKNLSLALNENSNKK